MYFRLKKYFDIYFCFSLKHQSLVEEVRYFLYSSFNGVSYAIKNLPNGLEKSVVMIYNYPFRPTWTDSLISSTTIFPELSMSNILKAQLTSSWNLLKLWFLFGLFEISVNSHLSAPTRSKARINSKKPIVPELSRSSVLLLKIKKDILFLTEHKLRMRCLDLKMKIYLKFWDPSLFLLAPEHHVWETMTRVDGREECPELVRGDPSLVMLDEPFEHVNGVGLVNISPGLHLLMYKYTFEDIMKPTC